MFSGAQFSLYPMSDNFIDIILGAIKALDPYRDALRIEVDDISTLIVGPPEILFPAMRDVFVTAAQTGTHCVLSATISRGCPGEPDDDICKPHTEFAKTLPLPQRIKNAQVRVADAPLVDCAIAAQFSLYPLGGNHHMDEIYGCVDFLKSLEVFEAPKNFCTKLRGDAGPVFSALGEAFLSFGAPNGHVAIDLTVSANSPSAV